MTADALWKKASLFFQPEAQINLDMGGPFVVVSEPSCLMTRYALGYVPLLLLLALWSFSRHAL